MATVKQKFLRKKQEALADVAATLQSALRIRAQMEDHAHGPAQPVSRPLPAPRQARPTRDSDAPHATTHSARC
jgi:hypothetical protein